MPQREKAFLVPFLLVICACCAVQAQANAPITVLADGGRQSTLGGMCFDNTLGDNSALRDLRSGAHTFGLSKEGSIMSFGLNDRESVGRFWLWKNGSFH